MLRDLVLADIAGDPFWYAGILGKRALATASLWKLWPYRPRDGHSMRPRGHPHEGSIDEYYRMTKTADFVDLGTRELELPVTLILIPTGLLILASSLGRWLFDRPARRRLRSILALLGCISLAALVQPVLVTTAGALETQAFVLVYILGFAFFLEESVGLALPWPRPAAQPGL